MYKLEVGQKWVHKSKNGYTVYEIIDIDEYGMVYEEIVETTKKNTKVGECIEELYVDDYFTDGEMQHISTLSPLWRTLNE